MGSRTLILAAVTGALVAAAAGGVTLCLRDTAAPPGTSGTVRTDCAGYTGETADLADTADAADAPSTDAARTAATGRLSPPAPLTPARRPPGGRKWSSYIPNVELTTHHGEKVRFYDDLVKGKIVVINFMYTTCTGT